MRVLVTGGAGYIGSHACKALAEAGHQPIVYDSLRTGHRWAVKWGPLEHGDITDPVQLGDAIRRHRPDAVMHFAALAYVGESVQRPDIYYRTNVTGALAVLDAMRAHDVGQLVFSSTCATYGAPQALPILESTPQAPINPYGRSKLMVEQILQDYTASFPMRAVALRYFNAAGADEAGDLGEEHDPEPHLLPLVLQAALGQRPHLEIYGQDYDTPDGTCIRDYIHVSDLAAAHVAALSSANAGFTAYNLGTGEGASVREIVNAAEQITGRRIPTRDAPRRAGDPPALVADASAARQVLNWTPQHLGPAPMIETAWRWMTEHRVKAGLPRLGG